MAALDEFKKIIREAGSILARDENRLDTIIGRYLQWLEPRRKKRTYEIQKSNLEKLCKFSDTGSAPLADLRVKDLLPHHVERYYDFMWTPRWNPYSKKMVRWTSGAIRCFLTSLMKALNWAAGPKQKLISENPIKGIEMPGRRSRGAEFLVSAETHQKALAAAAKDLRQLLIVLENTGCRPGELFMADARHFDPSLGALIYHGQAHLAEGENGHKTSSSRNTPPARCSELQSCTVLAEERPGPPTLLTADCGISAVSSDCRTLIPSIAIAISTPPHG